MSEFRSLVALAACCLMTLVIAGCGNDTSPVQTSPDSIDQYLQDNPEEGYSSDAVAEEMTEDSGEGAVEGSDDGE